jgi:hypothetical protein
MAAQVPPRVFPVRQAAQGQQPVCVRIGACGWRDEGDEWRALEGIGGSGIGQALVSVAVARGGIGRGQWQRTRAGLRIAWVTREAGCRHVYWKHVEQSSNAAVEDIEDVEHRHVRRQQAGRLAACVRRGRVLRHEGGGKTAAGTAGAVSEALHQRGRRRFRHLLGWGYRRGGCTAPQ